MPTGILGHLRRRHVVGLCGLIALACAVWSLYSVSLLPPAISARNIDIAAASARLAVDLPRPLISDPLATSYDYESLQQRTVLLGNLATTAPALEHIARRSGLEIASIAASTRTTERVQTVFNEPDSERRAFAIANQDKPYRLELRPSESLPSLNIDTQAPTVAEAQRLADAVLPSINDYLRDLARRGGSDPDTQVRLDQLGPARGAIVNGGTRIQIAALTFGFVLVVTGLLALGIARLRDTLQPPPGLAGSEALPRRRRVSERASAWRRGNRRAHAHSGAAASERRRRALGQRNALVPVGPVGELPSSRATGPATPGTRPSAQQIIDRAGDWPRTTRVLPWMVAIMMVIFWLVPFNDILLDVPLPVDLYLDRLVLPLVIATWVLVLAAGGRHAPRLRMTWIHAAIGAYVAIAALSLVLEARTINQTLEFDLAIKKLSLLGSYAWFFVIVASVVRRGEVRAFMTFTLALAITCALGVIFEYRFGVNIFYSISDSLLPGVFQIGLADAVGLDEIGRRTVRGPTQTSLEVVAIMAMALPIALVRVLQDRSARNWLLYGLASAVLLAATVATFRKTSFLAPISIGLTLAYYRRRELIKLAPLGVVLVLIIQLLSPGALSAVAGQLERNRLGVTTVSDRTADYDAIRPDVWTHLALGRGYGSYQHTSYRILDMELLRQLIEVGVIGLLAYIMMAVAVVAVARGPIRARRCDDAPIALAVAAAAVCFVVVSTLFDVMSFPHVPYVFLGLAGLLAATTTGAREPAPAPEEPVPLPPAAEIVREPAWSS